MRRTYLTGLLLVALLALLAAPALAQDAASTATPEEMLERAEAAVDLAFNLLGIFEAISVVITVAGGALVAFGFGRLISAENNLTAAREEVEQEIVEIRQNFAADLEQRKQEFDRLKAQITAIVEEQRQETTNATLATALLSFGERQYRAADYVGAINTYQRAVELDANNPVSFYKLGYVYIQQGELDSAEENLKKSLAIDEDFPPALTSLGYVYRRMGEKMEEGVEREQFFNRAERYMLDGLKISPKLIDEDGESWWGSLGGLYRRRGQIAQAIYAYEQACAVTPHSSYPFGNLANLYGKENNIDGMLRMYRRVEKLAFAEVQAEVDNYWGYFDLLTAQLALGHTDRAEEILPSVLETVPPDAVYALETLVDTLRRVSGVMEGHDEAATMDHFARRIETYIQERKQQPSGVPLALRPEDTTEFAQAPLTNGAPDDKPEDTLPAPEDSSTT